MSDVCVEVHDIWIMYTILCVSGFLKLLFNFIFYFTSKPLAWNWIFSGVVLLPAQTFQDPGSRLAARCLCVWPPEALCTEHPPEERRSSSRRVCPQLFDQGASAAQTQPSGLLCCCQMRRHALILFDSSPHLSQLWSPISRPRETREGSRTERRKEGWKDGRKEASFRIAIVTELIPKRSLLTCS